MLKSVELPITRNPDVDIKYLSSLLERGTQESRVTSSEQPLTGRCPLSGEKSVVKGRCLTVLTCTKDLSSECFLRNPTFIDPKKKHDCSNVLEGRRKEN
ncbi:hypothetical protein NPIL_385681 [Nephila pilipes]|uniref:Uncharacterized protein n=1 Tax=Nephila pilipes TaxID=299642 RepID=A0A8X6PJE1_NEPPI|nr:hypothetical protein NPIL_385681 [Nephila pilipes]